MAVALDEAGQVCGQWAGANSQEGWQELLRWAQGLGDERRWGIEGAWNYGRGLAQHLLAAGEQVHEMNSRWTAKERRRARNQSKSDQRDAQAIALYGWREGAGLPRVTAAAEDEAAVLEVLVTQRDAAVAAATRLRNQAHQLLLQCDPAYRTHVPALTTAEGIAALAGYQPPTPGTLAQTRASAIRLLGQRLGLAVAQAAELKTQSEARARALFPPHPAQGGQCPDGRDARRHLGARPALPDGRRPGVVCRRRPAGGLLGGAGAPPRQSGRQPPAQRHPLSHRS